MLDNSVQRVTAIWTLEFSDMELRSCRRYGVRGTKYSYLPGVGPCTATGGCHWPGRIQIQCLPHIYS